MARETITDLLYQYIRAVVGAGFRDGMLSGVREAMGLPAPEEEPEAADQDGRFSGATQAPPEIRREKSLPRPPRNIPPAIAGPQPTGTPDVKRGRGRPRKYPLPPPTSAPRGTQKNPPPTSGEQENPGGGENP